ncbi:hypothetical protein KP509_04G029200 [Ceratopteris richardii]|uniref:Cytochrome c oxidase subunit 6b-1 n=1 Tax=Ceratopteris richardii TaxID=49495 RepID=A0A8T2UR99_CERRI|nr:hypothetical protein KP509_04G029200 [Ceratopteris richardii]
MPSEEVDIVAESSAQQQHAEESAHEETRETTEKASEIPKIVEEETLHESIVEQQANEQSGETEENAEEIEEGQEEEEEEKPRKLTPDDIKTAPMDFRFPSTNQAKHCFTRYVEYHRCRKVKGEDDPDCEKYGRYYRSLCPSEWIEKWNEERENGTFPGPL